VLGSPLGKVLEFTLPDGLKVGWNGGAVLIVDGWYRVGLS